MRNSLLRHKSLTLCAGWGRILDRVCLCLSALEQDCWLRSRQMAEEIARHMEVMDFLDLCWPIVVCLSLRPIEQSFCGPWEIQGHTNTYFCLAERVVLCCFCMIGFCRTESSVICSQIDASFIPQTICRLYISMIWFDMTWDGVIWYDIMWRMNV